MYVLYMFVCMHVCMYVCSMYVCMYIHMARFYQNTRGICYMIINIGNPL